MPKVTIKMIPNHSRKLKKFKTKIKGNMKKALSQIGRVLTKRAKRNVSGLGFTRNKSRSSAYFGVKTGNLMSTLVYKFASSNTAILIGTNADYVGGLIPVRYGGKYQGSNITGHFLEDTLDQEKRAVETIFAGKVWKPLK